MSTLEKIISNTPAKPSEASIQAWFKIYGRTTEPNGNMDRSLRAEARDPLWFLTRQWQFGEFKAEDAGSPVFAGCKPNVWEIKSYQIKTQTKKPYQLQVAPLEPLIESENLLGLYPAKQGHKQLDLIIQISTQFNRFCSQQLLDNSYKKFYKEQFSLAFDKNQESSLRDFPQAYQQYLNAKLRLFDGVALLLAIKNNKHDDWVWNQLDFPKEKKVLLVNAAKNLAQWYSTLYFQPNEQDAWENKNFAYEAQFEAPGSSPQQSQAITLQTSLSDGKLDWFSFEQQGANPPSSNTGASKWFIPAPIRFKGISASRYWELEDGTVNLFKSDAGTMDLGKLIWGEFSLLYNDDWFVVPFEMNLGEIVNFTDPVEALQVQDVFGFKHSLKPIQSGFQNNSGTWQFLNVSNQGSGNVVPVSDHVFMLPLAYKSEEARPIEEINFIRDEMSNLVWAVEKIIPSPLGQGIRNDEIKGTESASAAKSELPNRYVLGSTVPKNWIPFIPVSITSPRSELVWQRALMPNLQTPDEKDAIPYKGSILSGAAPYYVAENEIPRAGRIVSRNFQRTRWLNGKTILWVGKKVQTGKGEGSSGLRFDQLE